MIIMNEKYDGIQDHFMKKFTTSSNIDTNGKLLHHEDSILSSFYVADGSTRSSEGKGICLSTACISGRLIMSLERSRVLLIITSFVNVVGTSSEWMQASVFDLVL